MIIAKPATVYVEYDFLPQCTPKHWNGAWGPLAGRGTDEESDNKQIYGLFGRTHHTH